MQRQRIGYIDAAKGILILFLLFGHLRVIGKMEGLDDPVLGVVGSGIGLYRPFFMQTFFLITGFCSTFLIGVGPFLVKNLKTLMLPAVLIDLLCFGIMAVTGNADQSFGAHLAGFATWLSMGEPWFIFALLWAKLMLWCITRIPRTYQMLIVAFLFLLGLTLNHFDWVENFMRHRHALLALPLLYGGFLLKGNLERLQKYLRTFWRNSLRSRFQPWICS